MQAVVLKVKSPRRLRKQPRELPTRTYQVICSKHIRIYVLTCFYRPRAGSLRCPSVTTLWST